MKCDSLELELKSIVEEKTLMESTRDCDFGSCSFVENFFLDQIFPAIDGLDRKKKKYHYFSKLITGESLSTVNYPFVNS